VTHNILQGLASACDIADFCKIILFYSDTPENNKRIIDTLRLTFAANVKTASEVFDFTTLYIIIGFTPVLKYVKTIIILVLFSNDLRK
jgi:hypothetical protein